MNESRVYEFPVPSSSSINKDLLELGVQQPSRRQLLKGSLGTGALILAIASRLIKPDSLQAQEIYKFPEYSAPSSKDIVEWNGKRWYKARFDLPAVSDWLTITPEAEARWGLRRPFLPGGSAQIHDQIYYNLTGRPAKLMQEMADKASDLIRMMDENIDNMDSPAWKREQVRIQVKQAAGHCFQQTAFISREIVKPEWYGTHFAGVRVRVADQFNLGTIHYGHVAGIDESDDWNVNKFILRDRYAEGMMVVSNVPLAPGIIGRYYGGWQAVSFELANGQPDPNPQVEITRFGNGSQIKSMNEVEASYGVVHPDGPIPVERKYSDMTAYFRYQEASAPLIRHISLQEPLPSKI